MTRRRAERGYISILALMMAALLAGLLAAVAAVSRPAIELGRFGADDLRADALLDAAFAAAGYLLFVVEEDPRGLDGRTFRFEAGGVRVTVRDDGGLVDLNGAEPDLLAGLYRAVGGRSLSSAAFAARVESWRGRNRGNDEQMEEGEGQEAGAGFATGGIDDAGPDDYRLAGLDYGPRGAPFRSIDELRLLLGLDHADFERLAPFVTVFNPRGLVDVHWAPRTVLEAVPSLSAAAASTILDRRRSGHREDRLMASLIQPHADFLSDDQVGSYRIIAEARLTNGYQKRAEAVIIEGPEDGPPYLTVAHWRDYAAQAPQ